MGYIITICILLFAPYTNNTYMAKATGTAVSYGAQLLGGHPCKRSVGCSWQIPGSCGQRLFYLLLSCWFYKVLVLLESLLGVVILSPQWLDQLVEVKTGASSPYPIGCVFSPRTSVCQKTAKNLFFVLVLSLQSCSSAVSWDIPALLW